MSLTAPIAYQQGISEMLIASSFSAAFSQPWGSMPSIDRHIAWTGTSVTHDGFHYTRQEKIQQVIGPYIRQQGELAIAACYIPGRGLGEFNCGVCEKCVRTQAGLLLAGVNPTQAGFVFTDTTLTTGREQFERGQYQIGEDEVFMWQDIKSHIPDDLATVPDIGDSHAFFGWLRKFDVESIRPRGSTTRRLDPMYAARRVFRLLPNPVQRQIYRWRVRFR